MIVYTVIMLAVSVLFAILSVMIYGGKTELIHDYHQTNVTDKAAYGKAFGKAMGIFPVAMTLSGILGLIHVPVALSVLAVGLVVGIIAIFRVQKQYNGGVFV